MWVERTEMSDQSEIAKNEQVQKFIELYNRPQTSDQVFKASEWFQILQAKVYTDDMVLRLIAQRDRTKRSLYDLWKTLRFHPRAEKLMRKQKDFLVVAIDEPYFPAVYQMIRRAEKESGRWTAEDELIYIKLLSKHELAMKIDRGEGEGDPNE